MEKLPFLSFDKHKQCAIRSHASFLLSLFFSPLLFCIFQNIMAFCVQVAIIWTTNISIFFCTFCTHWCIYLKECKDRKTCGGWEAKARYRNQLDYNTGDVQPQYLIGRPQHICIPVYNDIYTKECFVHFCTIYSDWLSFWIQPQAATRRTVGLSYCCCSSALSLFYHFGMTAHLSSCKKNHGLYCKHVFDIIKLDDKDFRAPLSSTNPLQLFTNLFFATCTCSLKSAHLFCKAQAAQHHRVDLLM